MRAIGVAVLWMLAATPAPAQELLAKVGSGIRQPVPPPELMMIMMRTSLLAIGQANYTNNYSVIRGLATKNFQHKNDEATMGKAFEAVRTVPLDYWSVAILTPQLSEPPSVSDAGLLRLSGFVPTRPVEMMFQLVYAPENGGWRLDGIGLGARKHPGASMAAQAAVATPSAIASYKSTEKSAPMKGVVVTTPAAAAQLASRR